MSYIEFNNITKTYKVGEISLNAVTHFRLKRIDMIESLKSVE